MTNIQEKTIIEFLKCVGISVESLCKLDGVSIERDELLSEEYHKKIKEIIPELKKVYSSSYLTSLQSTADKTHKWPVINIVRQILKSCGYNLTPKRVANGYTKTGKKIYKRSVVVSSISSPTLQSCSPPLTPSHPLSPPSKN